MAPGLLPGDLGPEVVGQGSEFCELLLYLAQLPMHDLKAALAGDATVPGALR